MSKAQRKKLPGRVAQVAGGARKLLRWWLEGAAPVSRPLAEQRAEICLTCPLNQSEDLFEPLTEAAALTVRRALERRHQLELNLPQDPSLKICAACGCELKLKLWEPIDLLARQTNPNELKALDPACWILAEIQETSQ